MHDDGTQSDERTLEQTKSGLNRRQLMKAGAWAAPVVVLAAAVPAAAASVGTPQNNVTVTAITAPAGWGFRSITVQVKNNSQTTAATVTVTVSATQGTWAGLDRTHVRTINPGETLPFTSFSQFIHWEDNGTMTAIASVNPSAGWTVTNKSVNIRPGAAIPAP